MRHRICCHSFTNAFYQAHNFCFIVQGPVSTNPVFMALCLPNVINSDRAIDTLF